MSKKKTKNIRQNTRKNKINYKLEFEKLHKENIALKNENNLLRAFNQPTAKQKIEIIEEYYNWIAKEDNDANHVHSLMKYKNKLKKQSRSEND